MLQTYVHNTEEMQQQTVDAFEHIMKNVSTISPTQL